MYKLCLAGCILRLKRRDNPVTFLWGLFDRKANSLTKGFQPPGFTFGVGEDFASV